MSKAQQRQFLNNSDDNQKQIVKLLQGLSSHNGVDRVWSDWVEMSAISIANAVDKSQFDVREQRYLEIVAKYKNEQVQQLIEAFAYLVQCWEVRVQTGDYGDVLGSTFMMLNMGNSGTGQFFTPYELSQLMGRMLGVGREMKAGADARGFARLMEPACGAGGMIIAAAHSMRDAGLNYQEQLHVVAIDIDVRCVHMTYLQLALLNIPAVIIHGNALSCEEWAHWYTPAHMLGQWAERLRRQEAVDAMLSIIRGGADVAEVPQASAPIVLTTTSRKVAKAAATAGQMQLF